MRVKLTDLLDDLELDPELLPLPEAKRPTRARAPSGSFCKSLESHAAASAPQEERCWPRSLPRC